MNFVESFDDLVDSGVYWGKYPFMKLKRPFKEDIEIICKIEMGNIIGFFYEDGEPVNVEWFRGELERYGYDEFLFSTGRANP